MYLIVGPTRVGKTLLLKRLMSSNGKEFTDAELPSTIPTVGTNLVNVSLGKKCEITIRELGGSMAPIWHSYYKECRFLIFVVDLSNRMQISAVCVQLLHTLSSYDLKNARVLLLMNKCDVSCMTKTELASLIMLSDIQKHARQKIDVIWISAKTGEGVTDVIKWLQDSVLLDKPEQS